MEFLKLYLNLCVFSVFEPVYFDNFYHAVQNIKGLINEFHTLVLHKLLFNYNWLYLNESNRLLKNIFEDKSIQTLRLGYCLRKTFPQNVTVLVILLTTSFF